ncbi:ABC transporter permease [Edaphobacter dinghuensis]|uniref:Permease n=1 Tax=Edaphobacter dinghuensis TaxID=1560005 RepID=A0A917HR05_9BACT|nr:ABC transporter permease [Edaphobacter dinghuensis]GGG86331.1 hypothetical protein GCM10011585_32800 [Edaphobacter dinghuensis]
MSWLRQLFSHRSRYQELSEPIREHLDEKIADLMDRGMTREQAERVARREFGNVAVIEERSREVWLWPRWDSLLGDAKLALRQVSRSPGFVLVACLTLALGIGANTAIFSVVNALLLNNLPYVQPQRIGTLYARTTGSHPSDERRTIDGEQWELLRDNVPSVLSAVSAIHPAGVVLQTASHAQYLHSGRISARYFDVLGIQPALGQNFTAEDDLPNGPRVAILSYSLWRTAFGKDQHVLGQVVLLKGEPYTVVGVLPEHATTPLDADIYTDLQPSRDGEGQTTNFLATVLLRNGFTWQEANSQIERALYQSHQTLEFARSNPDEKRTYYWMPLQQAQTQTLRPQVLALMLASGLVLLIACANLAGLALVRMLRRTGEIATRMALGASRWRIQRQLWIENLLVALIGGSAGIGLGFIALRSLLKMLPEHFLPVQHVPLDGRVLAFTLLLSLLTSILFGMLPAFATNKVDLRSSIGNRSVIGTGRARLRQGLIAGEVALTVLLLAAAGLLIHTLVHLETMSPGFNPNGVITAQASLDNVRYQDPRALQTLFRESLTAMQNIPGVESAAVGLTLPYERALLDGVTLSDGKQAGDQVTTNEVFVTADYFKTLQIPLLAGRVFTNSDGPSTQHVVVINETFARKFFHEANAVGRQLENNNKNAMVVGVVADTVLSSATHLVTDAAPLTDQETIYVPYVQVDDAKLLSMVHTWIQPSWIVRSAHPGDDLTAQMQRALASVDPGLPFSGFYSMSDLQAKTLAMQRIEVALLSTMAGLALLLSAIGIFALVAHMVAERSREIGIRLALGSTVREAMIYAAKSGVIAAAAGLILGLFVCAGVLRVLQSFLYGVQVYDSATFLSVVLTIAAVSALASTIPAFRVARIDPNKALREE